MSRPVLPYKFRDFPLFIKQSESQFQAARREAVKVRIREKTERRGKKPRKKEVLTREIMRELRAYHAAQTAAGLERTLPEESLKAIRHGLYMHLYESESKQGNSELKLPAELNANQREKLLKLAEMLHYTHKEPPEFAAIDPATGRKTKAGFWHRILTEVEDRYGELAAYQHHITQKTGRNPRLKRSDDLNLRSTSVGAAVANRLVKTNTREFYPIVEYLGHLLSGRKEYAEMLLRKRIGRRTLSTLLKQRVAGKTGNPKESLKRLHEFAGFLHYGLNLTLQK